LCSHFQSGSGCGGADELEGLFVTVERLGGPVPADLAEQTMLDGIPLGGLAEARRCLETISKQWDSALARLKALVEE